jgi:hypothetical protein
MLVEPLQTATGSFLLDRHNKLVEGDSSARFLRLADSLDDHPHLLYAAAK